MTNLWNSMAGAVRYCAAGLADLVLPAACAACRGEPVCEGGLCEPCNIKLLELVSSPYCPRCGTGLGANVPAADEGCRACPDPLPRYQGVVRLGPYADPLRSIIRQVKYRRQEGMRRRLGEMLAQASSRFSADGLDLVMPVPMHWARRLARGYDHARIVAAAVARGLGLPLGHELVRVRNTPPQAMLPKSKRPANVRGAFAVAGKASIAGANVLLVDDVSTTGATANEAARTLLDGGASRIFLAVIAKAEPPRAYAAGEA